jgi:hypothetical protein
MVVAGRVMVLAGRVWVRVEMETLPGKVEIMVVPAWVKVVGIPGRLVVTREIMVDAGRVMVLAG